MGTDALGAAFGFSEEEFHLNATGKLSADQEQMVATHQKRSGRWTVVAGLVIIACLAAMALVALVSADASGAAVAAVGAVIAVVIVVFALSVAIGRHRSADLRGRRISTVSGRARTRAKKTTSELGGVTIYRLKVGSRKFQLANKTQLGAFEDGAAYTVHYLRAPGTPILLSAQRD